MTWTRGTLYAFDTETTGVDVHHDRIVTATVAKISSGKLVDKRSWLIDPGIEIPEQATAVHGITTDHARANGVHPVEVLGIVAATAAGVLRAGAPLVVFNAPYDLSILTAELRRHELADPFAGLSEQQWHRLVDPLILSRGLDEMDPSRRRKGKKHTLPEVCRRYDVPFTETHDASADALGAGLLAIAMVEQEYRLEDLSPERLFTLQKTMHRTKQTSFRKWVEDKGLADQYGDIDTGWPIHSRLAAAPVGARA